MANRTVKDAHTVHGTNPQYLIEKIIRSRIYECKYWKEECFGLSAEDLVDKAVELKFIGGVYGGNIRPTPFICLLLKLLQIQPDKDIIIEFIKQDSYKYVRAIGATYLRLVGDSVECYKYLENLYNDYRKLKIQDRQGAFKLVHMDEFIDELLHEDRAIDIILPRITKRHILEDNSQLEPRQSLLDEDLEDVMLSGEEEEEEEEEPPPRAPERRRKSRSRSRSPRVTERRRSRSRSRDRARDKERDRERKDRHRDRHSRRDRERHHNDKSRSDKREKEKDKKDTKKNEIQEANELRAKLGLAPLQP